MFILDHVDADDLIAPQRPTLFQVIGAIILLAPLVLMALVILEESGRPTPTVPSPAPARSRKRSTRR